MKARIHQLEKSATQSGKAKRGAWVLEYEPATAKTVEPLMGWTASDDMRRQLCLHFDSAEDAIAYATRNAIPYDVEAPAAPVEVATKSYSDNFKTDRKQMWTH